MPIPYPVSSVARACPGRWRWCAALIAVGGLLASCQHGPKVHIDWRGGPFFQPTNFTGVDTLPVDVLRVAVLPMAGLETLPPESIVGVEEALRLALRTTNRFETVFVAPELVRAVAGRSSLESTAILPPELFDRIARELAADAVLFTDIPLVRSYPPLALGVRLKLVRLQGNRSILWAFDQVFDCRNPAVANSARLYAAGGQPDALGESEGVVQSPSQFATYAFAATFATLPRRPALPAGPIKVPRPPAD